MTTVHGKAQLKTYAELTPEQQGDARAYWLDDIMTETLSTERLHLFEKELRPRIEAAIQEANDMRTPWFTGAYILDAVGEEIRAMALDLASAESVFYNVDSIIVVTL